MESQSGLGEETCFDFKYIPNLSKSTQMENATECGAGNSGVEQRNFQALIICCVVFGIVSYCCLRFVVAVATSVISF